MPLRDFALLTLICMIWATNNIVSKMVVSHMGVPPLFYTAARLVLLTALTLPWLLPMPTPRWRMLVVALLMGGANWGLMFMGLRYASPSASAIVLQLGVPATALLSFLMLGERVTPRRAVGMAMTTGGAFVVMYDPNGLALSYGLILIAAATVSGSLGIVMMKQLDQVKPMRLQAWVAFASLWPMAVLSAIFEPGQVGLAIAAGWPFVAAVLFTALVVSMLAHTLFYGLIQRYEANLIGSLTLMTPLATIALGVLITRDHFDLRMAAGGAVALLGVLIVSLPRGGLAPMLAAMRNRAG